MWVTFLHPFLLLGLFGAVLPWLFLWLRRRPRRVLVLPSLFYFSGGARLSRPRPPWVDALLLTLLISLVVLALAHPVPGHLGPDQKRLVVFADRTPSLAAHHPGWEETLRTAVDGFLATHVGSRLEWADWNSVRDGIPPAPAEDSLMLLSAIRRSPVDNGDPRWGDFDGWRARCLAPDTTVMVVSAFSPRRSRREGPTLPALDLGAEAPVAAMAVSRSPGLVWTDEVPNFSVTLFWSGPESSRKLTVQDDRGRNLYVESLAMKPGVVTLSLPLPGLSETGDRGAWQAVALTLGGEGQVRAHGFVRRHGTLLLATGGSSAALAERALRPLSHDLAKGHVRLGPGAEVTLWTGFAPSSPPTALRGKPAVVLLDSASSPDAMDDGLSRLMGLGLKVDRGSAATTELTVADPERLPGALNDLPRLKGWERITRRGNYRVELSAGAEALWLWADGSPFLVRDGMTWIVIGAVGGKDDLLDDPLSVPLLTSLLLSARDGSGPRFQTPGVLPKAARPILENPTPTRHPEGLFKNEKELIVQESPVEETVYERPLRDGFAPMTAEGWGQTTGNFRPALHRILAALAALVLLLLVIRRASPTIQNGMETT